MADELFRVVSAHVDPETLTPEHRGLFERQTAAEVLFQHTVAYAAQSVGLRATMGALMTTFVTVLARIQDEETATAVIAKLAEDFPDLYRAISKADGEELKRPVGQHLN